MNALTPMFTLMGTLAASFAMGLLLQWLTLHALFHLLPGRRRATVAQVAVLRTRRIVMPSRQTAGRGSTAA